MRSATKSGSGPVPNAARCTTGKSTPHRTSKPRECAHGACGISGGSPDNSWSRAASGSTAAEAGPVFPGTPAAVGNVLDSGYGRFREYLRYKLARQGKTLIVVDHCQQTTRTCSVCGFVQDEVSYKNRLWTCAAEAGPVFPGTPAASEADRLFHHYRPRKNGPWSIFPNAARCITGKSTPHRTLKPRDWPNTKVFR